MPSYGMNPNLHYGPITMAQVNRPAECIMLGDSCHPMGADWRFAFPRAPVVLPGSGNPCTVVSTNTAMQPEATLHNMGSNVAFADGHAKWLSGSDIWARRATYMAR
ncbi:MAG: hypothetical protein FJX74_07340 [Armatimonadetes bacterium]|nr:hypothetical protein [Armatimonadota bacterium]